MEFLSKPSPDIEAVENHTLTCSAYGNIDKMSGKWSIDDETQVDYFSDGKIFTVRANVKKTGTYICSIKSEQEEIQTVTRVNIFTCKYRQKILIL